MFDQNRTINNAMTEIFIIITIVLFLILINEHVRSKYIFLFTVLFLVLFTGLRSNIGDTTRYLLNFSNLSQDIFSLSDRDMGFQFFSFIFKFFVNPNPQIFLLFITAITFLLIFAIFYNYSHSLWLSTFLFFFSGYYMTIINGVRQGLVSAIVFFSLPLLIKGKTHKFIIIILVLMFIHYSVVILIPIYYLVKKTNDFFFYLIALLVIISAIYFKYIFELIIPILELTQYGNYTNIDFDRGAGANVIRVFVQFMPFLIYIIFRKNINDDYKYINTLGRLSFLSFAFYVLAINHWIFARFSIYLVVFNFLLVPYILKKGMKRFDRLFIMITMLILYLIFFIYDNIETVFISKYLRINSSLMLPNMDLIYKNFNYTSYHYIGIVLLSILFLIALIFYMKNLIYRDFNKLLDKASNKRKI